MIALVHTVYSLRGTDDRVLYIGCTDNVPNRMSCHKGNKPWWSEVARIGTEFTGERDAAYTRERDLIVELDPPYNVRYTPRDPMPWFRPGHQLAKPSMPKPTVSPESDLVATLVRGELARHQVRSRQLRELLGLSVHAAQRRLRGEVPFRADELLVLSRFLGVPVDRFYSDDRTQPGGFPAITDKTAS